MLRLHYILAIKERVLESVLDGSKNLSLQRGHADRQQFDECQSSPRERKTRATKQQKWIDLPFAGPVVKLPDHRMAEPLSVSFALPGTI